MFPINQAIKAEAKRLGFLDCGIAEATFLEDDTRYLEAWLKRKAHGKMDYLERQFDLRSDPRKLLEGCRSVIVVLYNYYPHSDDQVLFEERSLKISKYAWGMDYHYVVKDKLKFLADFLTEKMGSCATKICVDSAPLADKTWAKKAGLGWIGKHTNLIAKGRGSFFFIGAILTDVALFPDEPTLDYCGRCRRCIDACPTQALTPYEIDATKCISYLTIELKDSIPSEYRKKLDAWVFGCDVCQDVCPWNRFSLPHQDERFKPIDVIKNFSEQMITELTNTQYRKRFSISPLARVKKSKLMDNLNAIKDEY